jgi:type III secretion protein J
MVRALAPTLSWVFRALGIAVFLVACAVPVASDLDDAEANRVFVALNRMGVDATKETDPAAEGKWRVLVPSDDMASALSALRDEELPRRAPQGLLDTVGRGSLVPSDATEHAQLVAAIGSELERSLEGVEGVVRARVHLSLPPQTVGREAPTERPTASVLIEHRGATPPLSADSVQRLVAGAQTGLLVSDVAVVMLSRSSAGEPGRVSDLAHVGPIAVARTSVRRLQGALVALVALVALLTAVALVLYSRLVRAQSLLSRDVPVGVEKRSPAA